MTSPETPAVEPVSVLIADDQLALEDRAEPGADQQLTTFDLDTYVYKTFTDDAAPRTIRRGRVSLGDRLVATQHLRLAGRAVGTLHTDVTVTNRVPRAFAHFTGLIDAVVHLSDGDLYATGFVDAAGQGDRYVIVGGTRAYAGAQGSAQGSEKSLAVTLTP